MLIIEGGDINDDDSHSDCGSWGDNSINGDGCDDDNNNDDNDNDYGKW